MKYSWTMTEDSLRKELITKVVQYLTKHHRVFSADSISSFGEQKNSLMKRSASNAKSGSLQAAGALKMLRVAIRERSKNRCRI